jgi:hypothetical protein
MPQRSRLEFEALVTVATAQDLGQTKTFDKDFPVTHSGLPQPS